MTDIVCKRTGKLLAKRDADHMWVWCKECNMDHPVELERAVEPTMNP